MGDALTELPPNLTRPAFWIEVDADSEGLASDAEATQLAKPMPRAKGSTMSWLVGGASLSPEAEKVK